MHKIQYYIYDAIYKLYIYMYMFANMYIFKYVYCLQMCLCVFITLFVCCTNLQALDERAGLRKFASVLERNYRERYRWASQSIFRRCGGQGPGASEEEDNNLCGAVSRCLILTWQI